MAVGYVLGIYGSPRRGGNSDLLLDTVLRGVEEKGISTRRLVVSAIRISHCLECGTCMREGRCSIDDDMGSAREEMRTAGALVVAAPIFFYGPPGHLKAFIDRCQVEWARKYVLKIPAAPAAPKKRPRKGYFVSVGATKGKDIFDGVILTAKYFFDAVDVEYSDGLFFHGVDEKGAIARHPSALGEAGEFAMKIVEGLEGGR